MDELIRRSKGWARLGAPSLLLALLAPACTAGPTEQPPTAAGRVVQRELAASWITVGPQLGGYAHVATDRALSLYATTWSLRLSTVLRQPRGPVQAARAAAWIRRAAGTADPAGSGLPPLERYHLVAQALTDLHQPLPRTALLRGVSALHDRGGLYRMSPKDKPTWGATAIAVQTLALLHTRPPAQLTSMVRSRLASAGGGTRLQAWIDQDLPVWQTADQLLPAADRAPYRRDLGALLTHVQREAARHVSPYALAALSDAGGIAEANSLPAPSAPPAAYQRLITPSGLLAGASGAPDPHLAYLAVTAGLPAAPTLAATLRKTATPAGWPAYVQYKPDPQSSYYALQVAHAWHLPIDEKALANLTRRWLADLARLRDEQLDDHLADTYYTLALAQHLSISRPTALTSRLKTLTVPQGGAALLSYVRLQHALGDSPSPAVKDGVVKALKGAPANSTALALASEAGTLLHDHGLVHTADRLAHRLQHSRCTYRAAPDQTQPDLFSTMTGLEATHAPADCRRQALVTFTRGHTAWLLPAATPGNRTGLDVAYYAAVIRGSATL
ncbi:hypothetical protein [Streptomyces sp. NBC_00079]|uniref:hypothetical protein n=1 Tax=Streptomyces sp. NBC_00079 TaxID=2975644 RepID=UPI00324956C5